MILVRQVEIDSPCHNVSFCSINESLLVTSSQGDGFPERDFSVWVVLDFSGIPLHINLPRVSQCHLVTHQTFFFMCIKVVMRIFRWHLSWMDILMAIFSIFNTVHNVWCLFMIGQPTSYTFVISCSESQFVTKFTLIISFLPYTTLWKRIM